MMKPYLFLIIALACSVHSPDAGSVGFAQGNRSLIVFAAASLTDAFIKIGAAFEEENPGVEIIFNFAGSSTLAAQIANGAPADVFASANPDQMQAAVDSGRIGYEPQVFAYNQLVIITPVDNPAELQSPLDLQNPGVMLVVAAPGVPVRGYTDNMLDLFTADLGDEANFRDAVLSNVVSEEDNVRQVALKVALGEADAGVVYRSDITEETADLLRVVSIPAEFNVTAQYPIAVTADTRQTELAQAFVTYVLSDDSQVILGDWGLLPVDSVDLPDEDRNSGTPDPGGQNSN